jgi:hypothetical protein
VLVSVIFENVSLYCKFMNRACQKYHYSYNHKAHLFAAYLYVIIPIVMQIQHTINFTFGAYRDLFVRFNAFTDGLAGIFLHLYIIKFPVKKRREIIISTLQKTKKQTSMFSIIDYACKLNKTMI